MGRKKETGRRQKTWGGRVGEREGEKLYCRKEGRWKTLGTAFQEGNGKIDRVPRSPVRDGERKKKKNLPV